MLWCATYSTLKTSIAIRFRRDLTHCHLSRSTFLSWSEQLQFTCTRLRFHILSPTVTPLQVLMNVISVQPHSTPRRWFTQCNNLAHDVDSSAAQFSSDGQDFFFLFHWAWGENKKIERRDCVPVVLRVSLSKLFISPDTSFSSLTKAMFFSCHHKKSYP